MNEKNWPFYGNLKYNTGKQGVAEVARPLFITHDPVKINTFFVMAREYAFASNGHLQPLKKLIARAFSLISFFSEKYGLE